MAWTTQKRRMEYPPDWSARRRRVLIRDGRRCQIRGTYCTEDATEVDHIRRGNNHDETNLQAACKPCHARKSSAEGVARKAQLRARRLRPAERHPGSV